MYKKSMKNKNNIWDSPSLTELAKSNQNVNSSSE